jgi:hypothetical protein
MHFIKFLAGACRSKWSVVCRAVNDIQMACVLFCSNGLSRKGLAASELRFTIDMHGLSPTNATQWSLVPQADELRKVRATLVTNISVLYRTAVSEIGRKDAEIRSLRQHHQQHAPASEATPATARRGGNSITLQRGSPAIVGFSHAATPGADTRLADAQPSSSSRLRRPHEPELRACSDLQGGRGADHIARGHSPGRTAIGDEMDHHQRRSPHRDGGWPENHANLRLERNGRDSRREQQGQRSPGRRCCPLERCAEDSRPTQFHCRRNSAQDDRHGQENTDPSFDRRGSKGGRTFDSKATTCEPSSRPRPAKHDRGQQQAARADHEDLNCGGVSRTEGATDSSRAPRDGAMGSPAWVSPGAGPWGGARGGRSLELSTPVSSVSKRARSPLRWQEGRHSLAAAAPREEGMRQRMRLR